VKVLVAADPSDPSWTGSTKKEQAVKAADAQHAFQLVQRASLKPELIIELDKHAKQRNGLTHTTLGSMREYAVPTVMLPRLQLLRAKLEASISDKHTVHALKKDLLAAIDQEIKTLASKVAGGAAAGAK
jgi:hypothetical protein